MLLDCDADLYEVSEDGQDVLKIAAEHGHRSVAEYLAVVMGVPVPKIEESVSLRQHKLDVTAEEERAVSDHPTKKENESYDMEKDRRKEAQKGRRRDRTSLDISKHSSLDLSCQAGEALPGLPEDDREGMSSCAAPARPSIDTHSSLAIFATAGPALSTEISSSSFSSPALGSPSAVPDGDSIVGNSANRGPHRLSAIGDH